LAEAALRATGVAVRLGDRLVLRGIDLEAPAGEILAVIGPNGAGKSTLLRALGGLVPYQGEILVGGSSLRALGPEERARAIGYVPQRSRLEARLLASEVVAQARYAHGPGLGPTSAAGREAVAEAMDAVDIRRFADRPFTELSYGEQRLTLIARALATGASIVLLDEPSAGLDVAHVLRLFQLLRRIAASGRSIVVVLHQLDEALTWAGHALLLAGGQLIASGTADTVISEDPVRRAYGVELVRGGGLGYRLGAP
jgi:iron complex transport system ATP-binding protein